MDARRDVWHLARSLEGALPHLALPAEVRVTTWGAEAASAVHELLATAYRHGGGSVDPFEEWCEWFTADVEFDAESCFLAWRGDVLVGVALCWSSAFVKDLCVAEGFRRRGLAGALLSLTLAHFRARGASSVELKVHAENPSGANELYRKLGFVRQA